MAVVALTAVAASPMALAEQFYGSIKVQQSMQTLHSATLTSPRVDARLSKPDQQYSLAASLALGYVVAEHWRIEGEYTAPVRGDFKTRWAPFDANVNSMQVTSQRLMLNGYRDFPISQNLSAYATLGLGIAFIESEGFQGSRDRRFGQNGQNNLAYSAGAGINYKLSEKITLGTGYRYVNMGRIETGRNTFANRINARDEQLKGKLKEQSMFAEARYSF